MALLPCMLRLVMEALYSCVYRLSSNPMMRFTINNYGNEGSVYMADGVKRSRGRSLTAAASSSAAGGGFGSRSGSSINAVVISNSLGQAMTSQQVRHYGAAWPAPSPCPT